MLFFVLAESLMISLAGGIVGLSWAVVVIPFLGKLVEGRMPPLFLSPIILGYGLLTAIIVGLVSGLLPGVSAMHMRVINALRRV